MVDFAEQPGPGIRLALVRGRRRQGKSFLLRRLTGATGGFYYQALEQEPSQALAALGTVVGEYLGVPTGRLAFADWEDAVHAITSLREGDAPTLVVVDEFPYLLAHSPELPSILQRQIDASRDGGPCRTADPLRLGVAGDGEPPRGHAGATRTSKSRPASLHRRAQNR